MSNPKSKGKKGEKDIVVWINKEEPLKLSIEMNKYSISNITIDRNMFFHSDLYISGLEKNNPYSDLKKTIQYNFNPDFVDKVNEPIVDEYYYRNEYGHILSEKSKIIHINIVKMSDIWYNETKGEIPIQDTLLYLFGALIVENEKDKFNELIHNKLLDKRIGKLIERIVLNMNSDAGLVSRYYDREESRIQEWEAEKQEFAKEAAKEAAKVAFNEGVLQTKEDMVISFYQNNVPIEVISKSSRLSLEEVEELIKNNKTKKKY